MTTTSHRTGEADGIPISVVVPARNSGATLGACLSSILREVPAALREVIVVDNGSTDDTLAVARSFPVRLESVPGGFVSRSRNVGACLARHPVVAFVDSDCLVCDGWYEAITKTLADARVGVCGRRHDIRDEAGWVERAWDLAHRRPLGDAPRPVAYVPAGNMAARRDVFLQVRGFDETLETGEDPDLCARLAARGLAVVEVPAARAVHLGEPRTLRDVFRRERWHGRGLRLRYGDGRLAPIAVTTAAFGGLVVVALAGVTWSVLSGTLAGALAVFGPAAVAGAYAVRRTRRPVHLARLWLIYLAYFLGRAAALPVVVARARVRRSAP